MVIFISFYLNYTNTGGGFASKRNLQLSKDIIAGSKYHAFSFGSDEKENIDETVLSMYRNKFDTFYNSILFYNGGLSANKFKRILNYILSNDVKVVVLDSSFYGFLARKIKKYRPGIKIVTFFHNVEYNLFRSIKLYWFYHSAFLNEKLTTKYSDVLITFNERDSNDLNKLYHRKADLIIPMTFEDKFDKKKVDSLIINTRQPIQLLFIGSNFRPNYEGIKWMVENVMPHVDAKLQIVGKGMEIYKSELERHNVEVIGSVDDLSPYYYSANAVVVPVFKGSGIKIKTGEALMYGKTVIGTKEAFEGYDIENRHVGFLANTKEEFIKSIGMISQGKLNSSSRTLYEEMYSSQLDKIYADKLRSKLNLE